ncbi:MAG: hypothetical protein JWQ26_2198, partial [Modestobacter sp.]|nr:hypothetical protein [Modestobacter sp.]
AALDDAAVEHVLAALPAASRAAAAAGSGDRTPAANDAQELSP